MENNYSHSDKKKVESCNDKLQDYESWFDEDMYNAAIADCEDWHKTFEGQFWKSDRGEWG